MEAAATAAAAAGQASATPRVKTEQPQLPEASSGVAAPSLWWRKGRGRELGPGVRSKVLRLVRTHLAALGGSVTSGLPFGTFTGDDSKNAHWLYHRKLAEWFRAAWPPRTASTRS